MAARAAGKENPIDGPYINLDDDAGCAVSSDWARRLGFQGKVVLHPRQLPIAAAAFAPGESELAWAREVDRAFAKRRPPGSPRSSWRTGLRRLSRRDGRATFSVRPTAEHRILGEA